MRTLVSLVAWLATRAGANVRPPGDSWSDPLVAPPVADKAGRLVATPSEMPQTGTTPSLEAFWALWAAAALIVLIVGAGYIRRRWRGPPTAGARPVWGRYSGRK